MSVTFCFLKYPLITKKKTDENRLSVLTGMLFPSNRDLVHRCCGTGAAGLLEHSSGRRHRSIFLAVSALLQSEEIVDLMALFESTTKV